MGDKCPPVWIVSQEAEVDGETWLGLFWFLELTDRTTREVDGGTPFADAFDDLAQKIGGAWVRAAPQYDHRLAGGVVIRGIEYMEMDRRQLAQAYYTKMWERWSNIWDRISESKPATFGYWFVAADGDPYFGHVQYVLDASRSATLIGPGVRHSDMWQLVERLGNPAILAAQAVSPEVHQAANQSKAGGA